MENENVKLRIYGMTCDDCVATVTEGLKRQKGVIDVKVSLKDGTGEVHINNKEVKPEELLRNKVFMKPSHYKATVINE
ncbi:MAG: heavy-metal-associated domain-containing protein [Thermoplasmata archaeon]